MNNYTTITCYAFTIITCSSFVLQSEQPAHRRLDRGQPLPGCAGAVRVRRRPRLLNVLAC